MSSSLLALLHFFAVGGLAMLLLAEWSLLRRRLEVEAIAFLLRLDLAYLVFAVLAVATGLARALLGDKPWAWYVGNPWFHAKIGVFVLIGLLSIWPTLCFMRWRRAGGADAGAVRAARRWVGAELCLLPLLPLCAVGLARGF